MEDFPQSGDNISDVLDAIVNADPTFAQQALVDDQVLSLESPGPSGMIRSQADAAHPVQSTTIMSKQSSSRMKPYIEIVEQPASKALRFRYPCEGRSAGSIPGAKSGSTPETRTYPTIRIVGSELPAVVVISCVTKDHPYRAHPHNLVHKDYCRGGVATVKIDPPNRTYSFDKLGIQCVKKKEIESSLQTREILKVDPFNQGFNHKTNPSSIDLNALRLCFQVYLQHKDDKKYGIPLRPVVSDPIYDKKANSDLVIVELSHASASVEGGTKMILLCEKVNRDDIEVLFYEEKDGEVIWQDKAKFSPTDVHRQVAITFTIPPYKKKEISDPVRVNIQLYRPKDHGMSEPRPFEYTPAPIDYRERKRPRRQVPNDILMQLKSEAKKNTAFSNQMEVQFDFNAVKTEPVDGLLPYGGPLISTASSAPQVGESIAAQPNLVGLRPMLTPKRNTPSPMMNVFNLPPPLQPERLSQPQQNLASQLQPIIQPETTATNVLIPNSVLENNLESSHGITFIPNQFNTTGMNFSTAIGDAMNVLDDSQHIAIDNTCYNFVHFNSNEFNNLNISGSAQEMVNGEIATSNGEEINLTDSFTRLARETMEELSDLNDMGVMNEL